MTPDEHAARAAELLQWAERARDNDEIATAQYFATAAQAHATLSLRQPQQTAEGFVPRHDNLGPEELAEPLSPDYSPGS